VTAAFPGKEVGIDFVWHMSLHATPGEAFAEAVLGQEGFVESVFDQSRSVSFFPGAFGANNRDAYYFPPASRRSLFSGANANQ
jgi:hypothetical protein